MALTLDLARAASYGIASPYASVEELLVSDPADPTRLVLDPARAFVPKDDVGWCFFYVYSFQQSLGLHFGGSGLDIAILPALLPFIAWFFLIIAVRYVVRAPINRLGIYLGVLGPRTRAAKRLSSSDSSSSSSSAEKASAPAQGPEPDVPLTYRETQKLLKFQSQMWLGLSYAVSTAAGYAVQRDQPWFTLPLNPVSSAHLLLPHPYNPPAALLHYYQYGLAFYAAELFSLFFLEASIRRSDFLEYAAHHAVTIALLLVSHVSWEHRFGAYVLFIHDASDIMLCVSKVLHYIMEGNLDANGVPLRKLPRFFTETFVNSCFAVFIGLFAYFRLYCLPAMMQATVFIGPVVRHGNYASYALVVLLNVFLQALHIYWAYLIASLVWTLLQGGERKDIRSDEDEAPASREEKRR